MEFKKVESLRRAKLDQREAAAQVAATQVAGHYAWYQRWMWCAVQILRHAWLNIYPLLALVAGVVFIFWVKQTREILASLQQELPFLGVLAVWAASIWYSMRVLSSTDFPGDADPHPAAKGCTGWLNAESPRVAAFAGLVVIACVSSIFLTPDPSPHWIPVLVAGVVPMTWAAAWLGNRGAGLWVAVPELPVYRWSTLLVALGASAIASYSWFDVPQEMRRRPEPAHLEDWLIGLCYALTLLPLVVRRTGAFAQWSMAGALAVWLWVVYRTAGSHPGSALPFLILGLAAAGLWFTHCRRQLFSIKQHAGTPRFEVGGTTFVALGVALALQLALVVALTLSPIGIGMRLGTLAILFLALALLSFFGIVWVFAPKYATLPSLALVPLLWGMFLGNTPDHTLRETRFAPQAPERPRLREHFEQWRAQLPKSDDAPIFFVASAGGGLRAAYWTATMLATADDHTCGEFGRHVYAYSGVSGGSLGVAAYLAQRQVWAAKSPAERCERGRAKEMARLLRRDFLAPVAGSLLFAEAAQRFVPVDYLAEDRGSTLARAWSTAWDDVFSGDKRRFDKPFLEVLAAVAKNGNAGPAVFLNATAVDSGQRVVASNVRSRIPDSIDLFRPVRKMVPKTDGLELREFDLETDGLTLREAVLNSARFTYVSPAAAVHGCERPATSADGTCPGERLMLWDRVVDGGYFENSGVATLSDVVDALKADAATKGRMFVIVIDNSNESELACSERVKPETHADDAAFDRSAADLPLLSGLRAPIQALLHVREARGRLEVRRLRSDFSCRDGRIVDWNLFGDQVERREAQAAGQEPALGWFLSGRSADWIGKRAGEVAARFPFRHAACHAGKLPTGPVRTVVGERSQPEVACVEPAQALKP